MWSGDGDKTFLWMVAEKGVADIKWCDFKKIKKYIYSEMEKLDNGDFEA